MEPRKSKGSEFELERRASLRNSVRISIHGGERMADVEDRDAESGDDIDVFGMADGFRPQQEQQEESQQSQRVRERTQEHRRSFPIVYSPQTGTTPMAPSSSSGQPASLTGTMAHPLDSGDIDSDGPRRPTPNRRPLSIAKPPRGANDSISLRNDGSIGQIQEISALIREESPYQGPSAPLHPYQMYPQIVRPARTASVTTTSTGTMAESSFAGAHPPAHPYGLYPQATVDEAPIAPEASIPVGFPGVPDRYQRRLGPDGEEIADIVGPDGHTEQLPPYTRYPDEAYARKVRNAEEVSAGQPSACTPAVGAAVAGPSSWTGPPAVMSGAGGIGLATRNPEFEPMDELDSPRSRHSSRSFATDNSNHVINTAASDAAMSEKSRRKTWQDWGRRRLWGIVPYWAVCLVVIVFIVMGVVLGAVVGTVLAKQHKKPARKDDMDLDGYPTVTVTYDATPIPTPTDLPDLVTGSFNLPLMTNRVTNTCFNDTTQSQAWNCNIVIFTGQILSIQKDTRSPDGSGYTISVTCNQSLTLANNVYSYGEQPFVIQNPLPMELVNDTFQPARGPAWFRMMAFNKTIILPEPVLSATPGSSAVPANVARSFNNAFGSGDFKRKGVAQSGDRPWICTWPETFLEIFIYPMQNSSWAKPFPTGTGGSWPSATPTSGSSTTNNGYGGGISNGGYNTATPTSGSGGTSTYPSMPSDTSGWDNPRPLYPRVVKIEERRIDRSPMPSCRQVEIRGDGQPARPVKDSNGNDVVIYIVENEPPPPGAGQGSSKRSYNSPLQYRDASEMSDCGCMWFIT